MVLKIIRVCQLYQLFSVSFPRLAFHSGSLFAQAISGETALLVGMYDTKRSVVVLINW
jgi:hypothetical protein